MLKGLKYSALGIFIISIAIYVGQIIKLTSLSLPNIVMQATSLFGRFFPQFESSITEFIQASENFKMYMVVAVVGIIVIYFIMISVVTMLNFSLAKKQEKNGITIGKILAIILLDFIGMYLLLFSSVTGLLNNVSLIENSSTVLGLLFIIHILLAVVILLVYVKNNYREESFKKQIKSVYKFSLFTIIIILIVFFINKVVVVLITNAVVDAGLKSIDVSTFVTSTILASIDFTKPVSEFLPPFIVTIASNFNLPVNSSLNDFGVNQATIESIVNIGLYQPINDSIFNFLNGVTNSFIFKGFGLKLFGLIASVALLVINVVKIEQSVVKHTVLVVVDAVIIGLIIFYFTSSLLIILALIVLTYDLYRLLKVYKSEHSKEVK
jgi:hypothetical protein